MIKIGDVELPYAKGADGAVTVTPTEKQIKDIVAAIGSGPVVFDFSGIAGVTGIVFEVDPKWFDGGGDMMILLADGVSLTIQDGMMGELVKRFGGKVKFAVKTGSIAVSISQDGKEIDWYSFEYPMAVSTNATTNQPDWAVMYDKASGEIISRSWYSDYQIHAKVYKTGTYDFMTPTVAGFDDTSGKWMEDAVHYMTARGIVNGVGGNSFAPQNNVTRAEFLAMLMRALDPEPQGAWMVQQFDDMPDGAYYYDTALKAKAFGIVSGTGDNTFNPIITITRQDMFTMLYIAMETMNMLPDASTEQFVVFEDWDGVVSYASNPLQELAKMKLIQGSGGSINPTGTATRAEAAQVIYNRLVRDVR